MASKKLITVFGATGNQGGSVIDAVLASSTLRDKYALRGVTRDPSKPAGQALAAKGVELVTADLGDASAVRKAVDGSYAVFGVTNYWEKADGAVELAQGQAIADAAFATGATHLVWSSLPYTAKLTGGKLAHIDHFDAKARVQEYIEQHKSKSGTWATHVMAAYFMTNVKGSINKGPDGAWAWTMPFSPDAAIPTIDIKADVGKYVVGALEAGQAADGVAVQATSEWTTVGKMVQQLNEVAGTHVKNAQVPRSVFKTFLPENIAEELTQNFELIGDYSYFGKGTDKKQNESDKLLLPGTKLTSWKEFVQANGPWQFE